jgi:DNA-binding NarL/FixJ family response regulator
VGRELVELAGPLEPTMPAPDGDGRAAAGLGDADTLLLRLLSEGRTNQEIAEQLAISEPALTRRLGQMFAKIGASSRAEATAFAFREGVL